jgi:hypothetical protein
MTLLSEGEMIGSSWPSGKVADEQEAACVN